MSAILDVTTMHDLIQAGLAFFSLIMAITGLFAAIRFKAMADFIAMPIALMVVGLIASVIGVIAIANGAAPILAVGILVGSFFTGFGIGLSLEYRTE